jgi:hypothetical protein
MSRRVVRQMIGRVVSFLNRVDQRLGLVPVGQCPACGSTGLHGRECPVMRAKNRKLAIILLPMSAVALVLVVVETDRPPWVYIALLVVSAFVLPAIQALVRWRRRRGAG